MQRINVFTEYEIITSVDEGAGLFPASLDTLFPQRTVIASTDCFIIWRCNPTTNWNTLALGSLMVSLKEKDIIVSSSLVPSEFIQQRINPHGKTTRSNNQT